MPNDLSVQELAAIVGGTVQGDATRRVTACAGLEKATGEQVSFLSNIKYTKHLEITRAGCVILAADVAARLTRQDLTVIVAQDPYYAFRQAIVKLHGFRRHPTVGIAGAVHPTAKIAAGAQIHAGASVGENVEIGANTIIYPHVAVMAGAKIGADCILYPNVTVYDGCVLGDRVIVQAGAVIGSDGYGFATHAGAHHKIPQIGNVVVQDDVEIGANTVIERAALESTVIGRGTKLGNSVVIGHNGQIGEHNLLVSQVGIAGSTTTGKYVVMAGQVGVAGHLKIADMTRVAGQSGIAQDIEEANQDVAGTPAMEAKHARRVYLQFVQLPELAKRVRELETQIRQLSADKSPPRPH